MYFIATGIEKFNSLKFSHWHINYKHDFNHIVGLNVNIYIFCLNENAYKSVWIFLKILLKRVLITFPYSCKYFGKMFFKMYLKFALKISLKFKHFFKFLD